MTLAPVDTDGHGPAIRGDAMQELNWKRMLTRERFGMTLCILAVACMSSAILQWSKHFPEQETALESSLFGDLVDETGVPNGEGLPAPEGRLPLNPSSDAVSDNGTPPSVAQTEPETVERVDTTPTLLVPRARFTDPVDAEPSSVQNVSYSDAETAGWLSGRIEEVDSQSPNSAKPTLSKIVQLGTIIPEE
ncbi:MAG: hypothetical protein KDA52_15615 [Planctomycetaceae bacterium]|nr:hypothetical protein [Planctomycetaceae bacterium]